MNYLFSCYISFFVSVFFFFSSRRRHTRYCRDWSSDVCSSDLGAAAGARVTGTVRNADLRGAVEELGAESAVDPEGFEEHGPFDVILELVGAPNMPANLKALDTGGRIVVIGVGAGFKAEVNLLALMGKRGTLRASTLRARPLEEKAQTARLMERHVLPLLDDGRLHVEVAETFPLDEAPAAYERFEAGGKLGKI